MLTSLHTPVPCLLLLLSFSRSGESQPHQRGQLLEAVKTGILSSLGMEREPRPTQRASEEEMRTMSQLYREKLREMRGNSSQMMREPFQSTFSTALFPETVEQIKVLRRGAQTHPGQRLQWYRGVFHKNTNIHTELTLARAELKVSRQVLDKPTSAQTEARREIKVKVDRKKPTNAVSASVSSTQDVTLDISPEVEKWMRAEDGQVLVVDVGMAVGGNGVPEATPSISLELGLIKPESSERTRQRRSNKEDDCDEQGWCCQKSITVSFKDIGWTDWVVAPAEYTMQFCDGACPHNYKPASMHTQVKSRLHQITKGETPDPCCVPAAYEPMVLMHYDSRGNLKLTSFDDLIVSKCHCA